MDFNRKIEYYFYIAYRKMKESDKIRNENPKKPNQHDIPTQLPEIIDTFISGKITVEELELIKMRKKKEKRERRKKNNV